MMAGIRVGSAREFPHAFDGPLQGQSAPTFVYSRIQVARGQVLGGPGVEKTAQVDRLGRGACPGTAGSSAPSSEPSAPHALEPCSASPQWWCGLPVMV